MLIDTHCHIHETDYQLDPLEVIEQARSAGVMKMICVGVSEESSAGAVAFARNHDGIFASVGVHPHQTQDGYGSIATLAKDNVVAIGEIGLDYFYTYSPREIQIAALESQIQTALDNDLPIIFHVREAFDDFWPIFDNFHGIRGVIHSFTDSSKNLEESLSRGFYIGVNGISTFTKDTTQQELFATIPLERLLLETDAPFLTPVPKRGKVNEPAFVRYVAEHHATIRGIKPSDISQATTTNAVALFAL